MPPSTMYSKHVVCLQNVAVFHILKKKKLLLQAHMLVSFSCEELEWG